MQLRKRLCAHMTSSLSTFVWAAAGQQATHSGESTMATGGDRQLMFFQYCISDFHDVDDDPGTEHVFLS